MKKIIMSVTFLITIVSVFAQENEVLKKLLYEINTSIINNEEDPVLPSKQDIIDLHIFDGPNSPDTFATEYLLQLSYIYSAFAKYFKKNEEAFVFFHINYFLYTSNFFDYIFERENVDKAQILSGFVKMLRGSLIIMCAKDELQNENRKKIALINKKLILQWWDVLPQPLKMELCTSAFQYKEIETDTEIKDFLNELVEIYQLSLLSNLTVKEGLLADRPGCDKI